MRLGIESHGVRALAALILPAAACLEGARVLGLQLPADLAPTRGAWTAAITCLPPLASTDYDGCRLALWAAALLLLAFGASPPAWRKPLLVAASFAYIPFILNASFLAWYVGAVLAAWGAVRTRAPLSVRRAAVLLGAVALAAPALALPSGAQRHLAVGFTALFALKGLSIVEDTRGEEAELSLSDCVLSFTGGFPCNFRGPLYTHSTFTRSFLARDYEEISRRGVGLVYRGAAKLAAAAAADFWLASRFLPSPADALVATGPFAWSRLWALNAASLTLLLARIVGSYQVLQGLTRLFGWDVEDQCAQPWRARSLLEFLSRLGTHNRRYLFQYAFLPAYLRGGNPYSALAVAFAASLAVNVLFRLHEPQQWLSWSLMKVWMLLFASVELYAHLRSEDGGAPAARSRFGEAFARVRTAVIVMFLAAQVRFYQVALHRPGALPGDSVFHRQLYLYGRLLAPAAH